MSDSEDVGESTTLAIFRRRHPKTGAFEQVRITTGEFKDRQVTHFRTFYQAHRNPTAIDDGYRPSTNGVVVREAELSEAIAALQEAKRLVESQGRRCSPAPDGERNPRPRTLAKQQAALQRAQEQAAVATTTERPVQTDALDDLAEYRERRPRK
jgi:hypothetical protein